MSLTDERLADGVLYSVQWQGWREHRKGGRWWEIPEIVRSALRDHPQLREESSLEFEKTVQRVTKILRSRWAKKGVETKRRRRERKKAQEHRRLAKARKALLLKKINKWERKRRTAKRRAKQAAMRAVKEPTFL
ncbi:hypothetical protein A3A39_02760 [Candidatus Kaiserbacteria bacterium RIFCSPLOWO2_01_FULL_54_13]|uniref:BZIP domain-containing protein n=1 Tax=Candidatus Kaiserbacteria bacterium RIFCSPLOWO2_01_FULL_54_13 TaxID=1798512 RepID=A0A1F6F2J1_9BACT|nr:MAG: hypothetical protein A3A39_02760 [Candidatus Kaiserbacteria bacterium RIFCSPLOWO2_01_FULL_54_13]